MSWCLAIRILKIGAQKSNGAAALTEQVDSSRATLTPAPAVAPRARDIELRMSRRHQPKPSGTGTVRAAASSPLLGKIPTWFGLGQLGTAKTRRFLGLARGRSIRADYRPWSEGQCYLW